MNRYIETIKITGRTIHNLSLHEERMQRTRLELFGRNDNSELEKNIRKILPESENLLKCRVEYDEEIRLIEFIPYEKPQIRTLKLVFDNEIEYSYKSTNREHLNTLHKFASGYDDALIVHNGLLTDTTICNIALFDGYNWLTP